MSIVKCFAVTACGALNRGDTCEYDSQTKRATVNGFPSIGHTFANFDEAKSVLWTHDQKFRNITDTELARVENGEQLTIYTPSRSYKTWREDNVYIVESTAAQGRIYAVEDYKGFRFL